MTTDRPDSIEPSEHARHERIRQTQDRTRTLELLDVVMTGDPASTPWSVSLETLRWIEDYRTIEPFRSYIEDLGRSSEARSALARTLASFDLTTTPAQRRSWWGSNNAALREYALRLMEATEADLVLPVAEQDDHPLQAVAIDTLALGFDADHYQAAMVRCLDSEREDVQRAAISGVIWDEPLAAESVLQRLINGEAEEVERMAADALQYYPSLATLRTLRGRLDSPVPVSVERQVKTSIHCVMGTIEAELLRCGELARAELATWAAAIDFVTDELPTRGVASGSARALVPFADGIFNDALETTCGSWIEKAKTLRSIEWSAIAAVDRSHLAERLVSHADPEIRMIAATPLAEWNETTRLLALAEDEHAVVRKSAIYALASCPSDPRVADFIQARLDQGSGATSAEALATFAKHAEPANRRAILFHLAIADERFSTRYAAIGLLEEESAQFELSRLLPLLQQPPLVNWAVHTAILDSQAGRHVASEDLSRLAKIDNIHVAAAAARAAEQQDAEQR